MTSKQTPAAYERELAMKKRPNAIWHMMKWGFGGGFVLVAVFFALYSATVDGSGANLMPSIIPFILFIAFINGAIPGIIVGLIMGFALWGLTRNIPISKNDKSHIYGSITTLTLLLPAFLVIIGLINFRPVSIFDVLALIIPLFLASFSLIYAAHRYLLRLHRWSSEVYVRKSKAKNDYLNLEHSS